MRIGIDARFWGPKTGGGGLGRYVASFINELQSLDQKNEYVLFLKKENFHECVITNPKFSKRLVDIPWYTMQEQRKMPGFVKRAQVDFMHYPHWNIPIFAQTPFIVTIHDLILLQDATSALSSTRNSFIHGLKYAGYRIVLETAIHKSRHIISVSEYTKASILKHFGIKGTKISVILNGVAKPVASRTVSLTTMAVYQPYFLYVGNAYPHKNLEMMLHAFSQFNPTQPNVQLVIAGRRDIFSKRLEKEVQEIGLPIGAVRFIDLPTDEELSALYTHASLFIFPSRIEGFGIPPLEAMSYGVPVAVARTSSLPEILKTSAFYFEPDDIEALISLMNTAILHPDKLRAKQEEAKKLSASYDWNYSAKRILNIYNNLSLLDN